MKRLKALDRRTMALAGLVCAALLLVAGAGYGHRLRMPSALSGQTEEDTGMGIVASVGTAGHGEATSSERSHGQATVPAEEAIKDETLWLLSCQTPEGAIAQTPSGKEVVPYFANLAAKTMVDIEPDNVRRYISWYIGHMNMPDRYGLPGTVYDYKLEREGLVPTYRYDSADSYAATFLSLVSYYMEKTLDRRFVLANLDSIDLAASVLTSLQQDDGLVVVMPKSSTKYLMDNCEAYRGLMDWVGVLESLGLPERASSYRIAAERVRGGIEGILYDAEKGSYAWSLSWYGKRFPKRGKWYPDAVSQIDPITTGVLSPDDPRAVRIWDDFNAQFPSWNCGVKGDVFPWAKIAVAAETMGDRDRAAAFMDWAAAEFAENGRPYPWYVLESASIIDLHRTLGLRSGRAE